MLLIKMCFNLLVYQLKIIKMWKRQNQMSEIHLNHALLDKNLLISSNEMLQEVPEEEIEDESNQSEDEKEESKDGLDENEDRQVDCPKRPTSDEFLTKHILKRQR